MTLRRSVLSTALAVTALSVIAVAGCARLRETQAEAAHPPIGQFVTVDGLRVHYDIAGAGPDLILLHGASGNLRDYTFGLRDRLTPYFRVIAFDRPGLGYSDPLPDGGYTLADQVRVLRGAADQLGVKRPILLGQSFGGAVALEWALEGGANGPAALVLLAAPSLPWPGGLDASYRILANPVTAAVVVPIVVLGRRVRKFSRDSQDRIVLTENLGTSGNAATDTLARSLINDGSIGAVRFFINGLDTTTRGLDVVGNYRMDIGASRWTLTAAYNRNKTKIDRRIVDLGPLAAATNIVLFGRVEGIRFEEGQPRDKVVLSADGRLGMFGLTARTTRYGRVVSPNTATPIANPTSLTLYGPDDIFLSPKWITDLELRVSPVKAVELALGANNLLDVYPDRLPFGPRPASVGGVFPVTQAFLPYSNFSPFGFNGRFLYGRVSVNF